MTISLAESIVVLRRFKRLVNADANLREVLGGKRGGAPGGKAKSFEARPPRREKAIDPDNPFAKALMGLKDKGS